MPPTRVYPIRKAWPQGPPGTIAWDMGWLVRCPSACGPSDDPKHRMVWHPPLLVRDIGIHAEEPPRLPLAQVGTQHRCFRLCRLAIVPSCKPWDICCPSNPTATLE